MDIGARFERLRDEWTKHCDNVRFSSNMDDYLAHPAVKKLSELGPAAVPLIMEHYQHDELLPWEFVLQEITGVKLIEDPDSINFPEVKQRRLEWWEKERAGHSRFAPPADGSPSS